ncbi:MAG TPA: hypothetical protein VKZ60_02175 [Chloroflexota bacterium]|nr:hypothetical protein [Chloroflexota bacterium]
MSSEEPRLAGLWAPPAPAGWETPAALARALASGAAWARAHAAEVAAWAAVGAVALLLRLAALGDLPLGPDEGAVAMDAWRLALGRAPQALDASATLTHGLLVTFVLVGASDYAARLLPALAGTALPLAPLLLRGPLGPVAAVGTGTLLALSPLAVFASRRVDAAILVAGCLLLLVGTVARAVDSGQRGWLRASAVLLALLLASGSVAVPSLLAVVGAAAIAWGGARATVYPRLRALAPRPLPLLALFAATLVLVGTAGFTHLRGLQAALVEPWVAWLAPFQPQPFPIPWLPALLLYDLPLALAAAAGLALTARREALFDHFVLWWAALGALPLLFQPPDPRPYLVVWAVPLALLGGQALAALASWGWTRPLLGRALLVGLLGGVDLCFVINTGRLVASTVRAPGGVGPQVYAISLGLALLVLGLLLLVHWALRDWLDSATLARAVALAAGILGLGFAVAANGRLQYGPDGAGRAELLRPEALRPEVFTLVEELRTWARQEPQTPIPVGAALRPSLLWHLRDVPTVQFVARAPVERPLPRSVWVAGPDAPTGERRPWRETLTALPPLSSSALWNWWLYRQSWLVPTRHDIIVVR